MKRKVTIKQTLIAGNTVYFVSYVERRSGQRHAAAQFDGRHATLEDVRKWIAGNPKLELVD